jgi:hypothetical protein
MFNATVVGRIFNGKVYEGKGENSERRVFRGRLNFRDRRGEYQWIDAVCFRDMGENGGLVGFLEENFSAGGDGDNGGQGIIVVGHVRPIKKKATKKIPIVGKKNGQKITKEVETQLEYETFEFVIEEATFPPKSKGETSGNGKSAIELDDEFDFDEDIEVGEPTEETEEEVVAEEPKKKTKKEKSSESKKKKEEEEDDDDDFFDE